MNLFELTGQESGVVVYGDEAIVCNWAAFNGLPKIDFFGGIIGWPSEIDTQPGENIKDLAVLLIGVEIIYDNNYDEEELRFGDLTGMVYRCRDRDDVLIIAPHGWA